MVGLKIKKFAEKLKGRRYLNPRLDGLADRAFHRKLVKEFDWNHFFDENKDCLSVLDNMCEAPTFLDKVRTLEQDFCSDKFWEVLNTNYDELQKSDTVARALKRKGDRFRIRAAYPQALRCYRLAAQFAPPKSKILVDSYWNSCRVALWFYSDFEGAMKLHKAVEECRQFQSYQAQFASQRSRYKEYHRADRTSPKYLKLANYFKKRLFYVLGEYANSKQEMASCISVQDSLTHGKGSFATESLEPGTTVLVDRPYVANLANCYKFDATNCFRCFAKLTGCVPCNGCVFYMYCSAECRDTDYEDGHKYECPCLPYMSTVGQPSVLHMCLKAVCKAGPKTLANSYKTLQKSPSALSSGTVRVKNSKGEVDKYSNVLNLCCHPDEDEIDNTVWLSYTIVQVLIRKSDFFGDYVESFRPIMANFLTCTLAHHVLSFRFNSFQITTPIKVDWKLSPDQSWPSQLPKFKTIGAGIYPTADKINHSCDGNVIMIQAPDGTLAMITNRKLVAGDQLFFSYGPMYTSMKREKRQKHLNKGYKFDCTCTACSSDWPTYRGLHNIEKRIFCPGCSIKTLGQNTEVEKYVLNIDRFGVIGTCGSCGEMFVMDKLWKEISIYEELLVAADELLDSNKPNEALPIIKKCISFYQLTMCPPSPGLALAQRFLRTALTLVIHPHV